MRRPRQSPRAVRGRGQQEQRNSSDLPGPPGYRPRNSRLEVPSGRRKGGQRPPKPAPGRLDPADRLTRSSVCDPLPLNTPTGPIDPGAQTLRLDAALQLLQQSGFALPDPAMSGRAAWLQAVVDGLCDLSSRDALTGLSNRRQFELAIAREI